MQSNELTTFVNLVGYEDKYQISNEYPYVVKNKLTNGIVNESINNAGYVRIHINGKSFPKHLLIAMQFIENDDPLNKTEVDHINSNKLDNRIDNLQWITHSENCRKRRTFTKQPSEYLPDDTNMENFIQITEYNGQFFDRYYYDAVNERILLKTKGERIKVIKPIKHDHLEIVALTPITGRPKTFSYKALMKALRNEYSKAIIDKEFTEEISKTFTKEELDEATTKLLNNIGQIIINSIKQRNDS